MSPPTFELCLYSFGGDMIKVKRVYEPASEDDGVRILVDRIWPRGVTKDKASIYKWLKEVAPSDKLRKWFAHDPEKWGEFKRRYRGELEAPEKTAILQKLKKMTKAGTVTLLFGAKEERYNNAVALKEFLEAKG